MSIFYTRYNLLDLVLGAQDGDIRTDKMIGSRSCPGVFAPDGIATPDKSWI